MFRHTQRYLLTGALTVVPLIVTWWVFEFFLKQLSNVGKPTVKVIAIAVGEYSPTLERWLLEVPWFQSGLAILLTLMAIYMLGWMVSKIVGRRVFAVFESDLARMPLVTKVYRSNK